MEGEVKMMSKSGGQSQVEKSVELAGLSRRKCKVGGSNYKMA